MKHLASALMLATAIAPALPTLVGCDALAGDDPTGTPGTGAPGPSTDGGGIGAETGAGSDGGGSDATVIVGDAGALSCATTFRYVPPLGKSVTSVAVSGEWNAFNTAGVAMMGPDAQGAYTASVELSPGLVAYKLIVNGAFELDPGSGLRKYVGANENSAVRAVDCHVPALSVTAHAVERASAGQGHFTATVIYIDTHEHVGISPRA